MPLTSFGIVIGGLSLIGVPGTAGFISKWYLILAAMEAGQFWLVGAILLSSLLAVVYVWRFVEVAYFRAAPEGTVSRRGAAGAAAAGLAAGHRHDLVRSRYLAHRRLRSRRRALQLVRVRR